VNINRTKSRPIKCSMAYKYLFFDLDHTLWDFDRNSSESLAEIFSKFALNQLGIATCDEFVREFLKINTSLWDSFDLGRIEHSYIRENRFRMVFENFGIACPEYHLEIGETYLQTLPTKTHLLDGAIELLQYASAKGYELNMITNGFNDIQARKMTSSGISHFFKHIVTFEKADAKKPDRRIFEYALNVAQAEPKESLMIGDNWIADILGAKQSGIDTVYLNPMGLRFDESPTFNVTSLRELHEIL
jgi:YjjG family noncanonical pyrimidine nucleotidase